jgi:myo-inositol-1(or 4)-monophosphatase
MTMTSSFLGERPGRLVNLSQLRDDLVAIVKQAGMQIPAFADGEDRRIVQTKGSIGNIVTALDKVLEETLIRKLGALVPRAQMIGEETGQHGTDRLAWVIDPIDGSTNLLHRLPHAAVSVALCEDWVPLLGVVHNPFDSHTYTAIRDEGAQAWTGNVTSPHSIRVSTVRALPESLVSFGLPYDKSRTESIMAAAGRVFRASQDLRRRGSASLDICSVASGQMEAHFEFDLRAWDVSAASLILSEAGGRLTTWQGSAVDWQAAIDRIDVVASNSLVHMELLGIL